MKNLTIGLIAGVLLATVMFPTSSLSSAPMRPRFEYRVVKATNEYHTSGKILVDGVGKVLGLGDDGWEMVNALPLPSKEYTETYVFFFKRIR